MTTDPTLPVIDTFDNPYPSRRFHIVTQCPEFTSMCPKTGLPDFGTIHIDYVPDKRCFELKSFKYYMLAYRSMGAFYERVTNMILDDIVKACDPHWIEVKGEFTARGGINTTVIATHEK